ncbi:MAG: MoxR family ATPase [Clostridiales bacterium]|nr:MoxR family ATPase [Clostridiales bacterium]
MEYQHIQQFGKKIRDNVNKVMIGRDHTCLVMLSALLSGGHVLLEDMPGTGKTVLAKSLAKSMALSFARIQFTPDLLPSDVTGISVYQPRTGEFEFKKGPVFTNILLADEINRATPRTQSALLECMEEKQVTEGGVTRKLQDPFMVVATQNPVEIQGTFPLPEAQLDRFLVRLNMGYPAFDEAMEILRRFIASQPLETLESVTDGEEILAAQKECEKCKISEDVLAYMVRICEATRDPERTRLGASPRALLALMRITRAYAALQGRDFATPDDVKALAIPVLSHRIVMKSGFGGQNSVKFMEEILKTVPAPTEQEGAGK